MSDPTTDASSPGLIDELRQALTGWNKSKSQASGKGGDQRERSIDSQVDAYERGPTPTPNPQAQTTDASNRY